jgi:hypothetical protein
MVVGLDGDCVRTVEGGGFGDLGLYAAESLDRQFQLFVEVFDGMPRVGVDESASFRDRDGMGSLLDDV